MSAGEIFTLYLTFYEALLQAVGVRGQLGNVATDLLCHIWDYAGGPWGKENESEVDVKETVTGLTVEAMITMYRGFTQNLQQVSGDSTVDILANIGKVMQSVSARSTEILAGCKPKKSN
eukprot:TRINITY_DN46076_c0_g1_i1.p2 TRINITY_DN46076_c0_g1~~TRINITY_DN46076_c0_g1_i1.p2  ORF type:complete len:119 (+),score=14.39 TRINITY_DN46076_c0_g1_i1:1-357(+)